MVETDYNWEYVNGDLATVSDADDIIQSIDNRLLTRYDELNWIYDNYGCNFRRFLGDLNNETTLEFVKNSIKDSLKQDDRYTVNTIDFEQKNGKLTIILTINYNGDNYEVNVDV